MLYHLLAPSFFKKTRFCLKRLVWLFLLVPVLSGFTLDLKPVNLRGDRVLEALESKKRAVIRTGGQFDSMLQKLYPGYYEAESSGIIYDLGYYDLNIGMFQRLIGFGGPEASIKLLDDAKRDLKLAQEALSAGNKNPTTYAGTRVERVLLHEVQALNHLVHDKNIRNARGVMLQAEKLMENPKEGIELASTRMLAGMVYELGEEYEPALASYRKALSVMDGRKSPPPVFLAERMIVLTDRLGLDKENGELKKRFKIDSVENTGHQLWVWDWTGLVSSLQPRTVKVAGKASKKKVKVTLPHYKKQSNQWESSIFIENESGSRRSAKVETVENIDLRVREELKLQMPLLTERALAYAASIEEEKAKIDETLGGEDKSKAKNLLGGALKLATKAKNLSLIDLRTRSWETLPSRISFTHMPLNLEDKKVTIKWPPRGNRTVQALEGLAKLKQVSEGDASLLELKTTERVQYSVRVRKSNKVILVVRHALSDTIYITWY